jgi:8-oxo-dGTP pyrophosphatase MutT (NUDIX family)
MKAVLPFNAEWLAGLHARARVPPQCERIDLVAVGELVGSVIIGILDEIALKSPSNINSLLYKTKQNTSHKSVFFWQIDGDLSQVLNQIALSLRDASLKLAPINPSDMARHAARHLAHHWRDEQLAVTNAQGVPLGTVERGAVRALGIATRAVHLVGRSPDGRFWVQQRSLDKSNDPGLWDTLMGGMVSAQDSVQTALVRETWEEAGLHLATLGDVAHGGCITVTRPSGDEGPQFDDARALGIGYLVESTDWFQATVPDGVVPVNQDGEVAQFELLDEQALVARLERDEFTLEAALILVAALGPQPTP